jgi:Meiotically Up-regulated Gene 113 (MUG113) protein
MARQIKNYCNYSGPCGNSRWRRPKNVTIYLMRVGESDIYKIGYTSNTPEERIRVIRYYFPEIKLIDYVLYDFSIEKQLHNKFSNNRVNNGYKEFFLLTHQDISYVTELFNTLRNGKTEEKRS